MAGGASRNSDSFDGRLLFSDLFAEAEKNEEKMVIRRQRLDNAVIELQELGNSVMRLGHIVTEWEKMCVENDEREEKGRKIYRLLEEKKLTEKRNHEGLVEEKRATHTQISEENQIRQELENEVQEMGMKIYGFLEEKEMDEKRVEGLIKDLGEALQLSEIKQKKIEELEAVNLKLEESNGAHVEKIKILESQVGEYQKESIQEKAAAKLVSQQEDEINQETAAAEKDSIGTRLKAPTPPEESQKSTDDHVEIKTTDQETAAEDSGTHFPPLMTGEKSSSSPLEEPQQSTDDHVEIKTTDQETAESDGGTRKSKNQKKKERKDRKSKKELKQKCFWYFVFFLLGFAAWIEEQLTGHSRD